MDPVGYRTNRAAQVRMQETKRKLTQQESGSIKYSQISCLSPKRKSLTKKKKRGVTLKSRSRKSERSPSRAYRSLAKSRVKGEDEKCNGVRASRISRGHAIGAARFVTQKTEDLVKIKKAVETKKKLTKKLNKIVQEIAELTAVSKENDENVN